MAVMALLLRLVTMLLLVTHLFIGFVRGVRAAKDPVI